MRPLTAEQTARAYASLQGQPDKSYAQSGAYKDSGAPIITGADMSSATAGISQIGTQQVVNFTLNAAGAKKFYDWTSKNIGKPLPIFLDKQFISGPTIQSRDQLQR